jgi:hypothetical protein
MWFNRKNAAGNRSREWGEKTRGAKFGKVHDGEFCLCGGMAKV